MHHLFMIGFTLTSWRVGVVRHKPGVKTVWGLGPFRAAVHYV
jgi:hypothetical protein